ncbi:DUF6791 domain-containing protein [Sphingomonas sp. MMS24-JH45]
MSRALFSRNADLAKLREEGYLVQIVGGFLVMREVPYVDADRKVRKGTLIWSLALAGDQTRPPDTHVVHFNSEFPASRQSAPHRRDRQPDDPLRPRPRSDRRACILEQARRRLS